MLLFCQIVNMIKIQFLDTNLPWNDYGHILVKHNFISLQVVQTIILTYCPVCTLRTWLVYDIFTAYQHYQGDKTSSSGSLFSLLLL